MTSSTSKTSDSVKRKLSDGCEKSNCRYGKSCYRTNPTHLEEFNHPLGIIFVYLLVVDGKIQLVCMI